MFVHNSRIIRLGSSLQEATNMCILHMLLMVSTIFPKSNFYFSVMEIMECVFHLDEFFPQICEKCFKLFYSNNCKKINSLLEFKKELNHDLAYLLKQKKSKHRPILVFSIAGTKHSRLCNLQTIGICFSQFQKLRTWKVQVLADLVSGEGCFFLLFLTG